MQNLSHSGLRVADKDSDWAQMILKLAKIEQYQLTQKVCCLTDCMHVICELSVNLNMRKSGLTGQKMRNKFNKIFWNENVCALSACLSEKQMQLYLITEDSASLITNQGH